MSEPELPAEGDPSAPGGEDATAAPEAKRRPSGPRAVVRYGLMRRVGESRHNLPSPPSPGTRVVVRTERGVELGEVVAPVCEAPCAGGSIDNGALEAFIEANGPDYPLRRGGRILRLANPQDVIDHEHLQQSANEERAFCRQQIRELDLPMHLVTVEHLLGGERIVFYFSAESRVDFRELVRRLASQYRTRIEMRQVGARDEARLVGDYERCGRRCCCQQFLKDLKPVSMRMAKTQKASLDPSKISGRCGRLMCCLRYEDAGYGDLRRNLPRRNSWVRVEEGVGRVVDAHILSQLVAVAMQDGTQIAVRVEDLLERDLPSPPLPEKAPAPPKPVPARATPPDGAAEARPKAQPKAQAKAPAAAEDKQGPEADRRRRRRTSRRKRPAADTPQAAPAAPADQQPPQEEAASREAGAGEGAEQQGKPPHARPRKRGRKGRAKSRRRRGKPKPT